MLSFGIFFLRYMDCVVVNNITVKDRFRKRPYGTNRTPNEISKRFKCEQTLIINNVEKKIKINIMRSQFLEEYSRELYIELKKLLLTCKQSDLEFYINGVKMDIKEV